MEGFWSWWNGLGGEEQLMLIALLTSGIVYALNGWTDLNLTSGAVKQYVVAALAFLSAYVATEGELVQRILAGVLAFLAAIGVHQVFKHQVARRVKAKKAP